MRDLLELKKLQQNEERILRKILAMEQLLVITTRLDKKHPSVYEKNTGVLGELVWLQKYLNEFPEILDEIKAAGTLPDVMLEVIVECPDDGQMCIPGFEEVIKQPKKSKKAFSLARLKGEEKLVKSSQGISMQMLLLCHDKQMLENLCRYLMIDTSVDKGVAGEELACLLVEYICKHPAQLLPALSISAVQTLVAFADMESGTEFVVTEKDIDDYCDLLLWGLLSMEIVIRDGKTLFAFSVSDEAAQMILPLFVQAEKEGLEGSLVAGYLNAGQIYSLQQIYERQEEMFLKIKDVLALYGAMEENEMHHMFAGMMDGNLTRQDFLRLVYLKGTLHKNLETVMNSMTKERFIGLSEGAVAEICERHEPIVEKYYAYSNYEEIQKRINSFADSWKSVEKVLMQWDLSAEELYSYIENYHEMIISGESLDYIMNEICYAFDIREAMDSACLWRGLLNIILEYPCYFYKGYSRLQAEEEFGIEWHRNLFDVQSSTTTAKTDLTEISMDSKIQLGNMYMLSRKGRIKDVIAMERQMKNEGCMNLEVNAVITMNIVEAYSHLQSSEQQNWKEEVTQHVENWCYAARNLEECELMTEWCSRRGISVDVRKKTGKTIDKLVKVYPNSPCPCGSGRKYKKCCGRN